LKAIRIHEDGGPEVLRYEDAPEPVPGDGEVLVRLRAASLNHLDVWIRKGLPSVPKPRILGADGAGERVDTGERVVINPGLEHGDVITVVGEHMDGTHAELVAVPESNVYPIPDSLSFEEAAAFPLVFETSWRMLVTKASLRPGEWVLVWGIGGGVATASLAIAKALGARVIVTSSSDEKLARAQELGADATVNHATEDVARRVKDLSDGGVHVVVETVGADTWATSLGEAADGLRLDDGHARGLRSGVRAREVRPCAAGHRYRAAAKRGARRPRAHGARRAARQDRLLDRLAIDVNRAGAGH
jgi:NADPH:quinone reductase-like Zn-dependent oxidoreductase